MSETINQIGKIIEKNRILEREIREITDVVGVIANNAYDFVISSLTVNRIKKKVLEDGCNKPFFMPDGTKLTLEIKLTLGEQKIIKKVTKKTTKKKKKSSVKKTGKL